MDNNSQTTTTDEINKKKNTKFLPKMVRRNNWSHISRGTRQWPLGKIPFSSSIVAI